MAEGNRIILDDAFTKGRFAGKVAVVTGGSSGIAKAVVERFCNDGAAVHFFDINEEAGRRIESSLRKAGYEVAFHNVDITKKSNCEEAVAKVAAAHGGEIHMLFNGAGYVNAGGLDTTSSHWNSMMGVHVEGPSNMAQCCYPYMKKDQNCSIVNVSSIAAQRVEASLWAYSAAKGAIWTLTRCMALDLSPKGVRVNSITPSATWTPMVAKIYDGDREKTEKHFGPSQILGRIAEAEEVAATAAFLCSRDARFLTGVDIPVDGGYLLMSAKGKGDGEVLKTYRD